MIDTVMFYSIHIAIFVPKIVYYNDNDIYIIFCSVVVFIVMISS